MSLFDTLGPAPAPGRFRHPDGSLVFVAPVLAQHGSFRVRTGTRDRLARTGDYLVGWPDGRLDVVTGQETALWRRVEGGRAVYA